MQLVHLNIERICIHQIFKRKDDGTKKMPEKSSDFVRFDDSAMETFKLRVIDALGSHSKAVDMMIVNQSDTDAPSLFTSLKTAEDAAFIEISYKLADKLADAQNRRNLQGGIVVIFEGTFGSADKTKARSLVGVIKADIHSAYQKTVNPETNEISLKYVKEALLTPSSKLFKAAIFAEKINPAFNENLNDIWQISIADHQISQSDGKIAAQYFYEQFLGCGYPESSARNTKKFYDETSLFISKLEMPNEEKHELNNALVCYLKLDKSAVIDPNQFAQTYFDADTSDEYIEFLVEKELPTTSFAKETQHISSQLKFQKVSFGNSIKLTAPAEAFQDLVIIEAVNKDENGNEVNWTKLLIKKKMKAA